MRSPALPGPWLGKQSHPGCIPQLPTPWRLRRSLRAAFLSPPVRWDRGVPLQRGVGRSQLAPLSPQEAVGERKAAAKQRAALQRQKGKLSDLEEEAKERAQHLLQRASRMRTEQEDEIKEFSEVPVLPQHR